MKDTNNKKRSWKRLVTILSCVVVFCTTYALILPAVAQSKTYYCGKEEHTHSEDCYHSSEPLCGKEEVEASEGHTHSDECYELVENKSLICGQEESELHVHDNSCYQVEQVQNLICGKEESEPVEGHTHSDDCYKSEEVLCGKEEHTHSRECESNKEDVEDPNSWNEAYKEIAKEEDAKKRILTVAKNELNYKENEANFEIDEEGKEHYYTRYGHFYEDKYGDWNNYFTGFVLNYANVQMNFDKDISKWQVKTVNDQNQEVGKEGNVVFFRDDEGELRSGILVEFNDLKNDVKVIQGNVDNRVQEVNVNKEKVIVYLDDEVKIEEEDTPLAGGEEDKEDNNKEVEEPNNEIDSSSKKVLIEGVEQPVEVGSQITVKASQSGFDENAVLKYQWQYNDSEDCADDQWKDVVGETNEEFTIDVTEENIHYFWRVLVEKVDPQTPSVPENASYKLKMNISFLENVELENNMDESTDESIQEDSLEENSIASSPFQLAARATEYTIVYHLNTTNASNKKTPLVGGQSNQYSETTDNVSNYYVRIPNPDEYFTNNVSHWTTAYTFKGWRVGSNNSSNSNGAFIEGGSNQNLTSNFSRDNTLHLWAEWEGARAKTVEFYININLGEYDEYSKQDSAPVIGDFMNDAVYTTSLKITEDEEQKNNQDITLYNTTGKESNNPIYLAYQTNPHTEYITNLNDNLGSSELADRAKNPILVDQDIRNLTTVTHLGLVKGSQNTGSWNTKTNPRHAYFQLASVPSDELILERVREQQSDPSKSHVKENGKDVEVEDLVSRNYTVHWYVLKGAQEGNWHIDGTLVRKEGKLTVTKTFSGNEEAIVKAKENFEIEVKDKNNSSIVQTLYLNKGDDYSELMTGDKSNSIKPIEISSDEKTFTWVVPVKAGKEYQVFEKNYLVDSKPNAIVYGESMGTIAEYAITNNGTTGSVARQVYTSNTTIEVEGKNYANNVPYKSYETVNFFNTYVPTNELLITKTGDFGIGIPNIRFQLLKDDVIRKVYKDPSGVYTTYGGSGTEECDYLETDSEGHIRIRGIKSNDQARTYILREIVPEGYETIGDIKLEVDSNGNITLKNLQNNKNVSYDSNSGLKIVNKSKTLNLKVIKDWTNTTTQSKNVKVVLMRNGQPVMETEQELNKEENNWSHVWEDLPSHRGGQLIEYSVRETWIGNTAYDAGADASDGYADYVVEYTDWKPSSTDENLKELTVMNTYVDSGFIFYKLDQNEERLAGAKFGLYRNLECTKKAAEATADINGIVKFPNLRTGVTYYLKEISAPDGYELSKEIYKVNVTEHGTLITKEDDTLIGNAIRNNLKKANLQVKKIDNKDPDTVLADAEFELTKTGDTEFSQKLTSGSDGLIKF